MSSVHVMEQQETYREQLATMRRSLAYWSRMYCSTVESSRLISAYCLYLCRTITRMEQELIELA